MTPKEKAKELWFKYVDCDIVIEGKHSIYKGLTTYHAKKCALIVVDELMEADWYIPTSEEQNKWYSYWEEVKQEIEKL